MRATAIVIKKDKILLIHRFNQREYYVFPGGSIEKNETPKEAVIREIKEETNLDVKIDKKLWEVHNDFDKRIAHFYLITKFTGRLKLGGPEAEVNSEDNKFILEWHSLQEIHNLNLVPEDIKNRVIEEFC